MNLHVNGTPERSGVTSTEPVAVSEALRLVLVALVALGWMTLDEPQIMAVVSAVAAVGSVVASVWARRRVTPTR